MEKIRVFEAFAGYGSQLLAMRRLQKIFPDKIEVIPVGFSEIDQQAIKAYLALHGNVINYGDISKIQWDEVPEFDLFTYSFPCTDISQAGLQQGLSKDSGTRSSLLWECEKAIRIKRPKYLLMENVKALVSGKFVKDYHSWVGLLDSYGYSSYGKVLNAKDYGVPQNRERIFLISIRIDNGIIPKYFFPKPFPLERRLKDVLEEHVDEKYYLSDKMLEYFNRVNEDKTHNHKFSPADMGGAARTVKAKDIDADSNFVQVEGYCSNSQDGVVCNKEGISPCHTAGHGNQPKIIE